MAAKRRSYQSSIECPDIPFDAQVEGWVVWAISSNSDLSRTASVLDDPSEIESLRDYTEACVGLPVSEADIVAAMGRIIENQSPVQE